VAVLDLLLLARLTGDTAFEERAARALAAAAGQAAREPSAHAQLLIALDLARGPAHEVAIVGARGADDTRALLRAVNRAFLPNAVVHLVPTGADAAAEREALRRVAPWTADLETVGGAATAYVCRAFACELPTTDAGAMLRSLGVPAAEPPADTGPSGGGSPPDDLEPDDAAPDDAAPDDAVPDDPAPDDPAGGR
jgi:hypothetical protein